MSVLNFIAIQPIVFGTFHSKPQTVSLMVALEKKSGITKVIRLHPLWNMNTCTKCRLMEIHPIIVEILQPRPKWWTDRPTLPPRERCHQQGLKIMCTISFTTTKEVKLKKKQSVRWKRNEN